MLADSQATQSPRQRLKREEQQRRQAAPERSAASTSQATASQSGHVLSPASQQEAGELPPEQVNTSQLAQAPLDPIVMPLHPAEPKAASEQLVSLQQDREHVQELDRQQARLEEEDQERSRHLQEVEAKVSELQKFKHDLVTKLKQVLISLVKICYCSSCTHAHGLLFCCFVFGLLVIRCRRILVARPVSLARSSGFASTSPTVCSCLSGLGPC